MKKLCLIAVIGFVACEDPIDPLVPTLTLSADSLTVAIGANTSVTATITNSSAVAQFVSRDEAIARVNVSGTITGVAAGTTYIISSLSTMPNVRDSVRVRVSQGGGQPVNLPVLGSGSVPERFTGEVAASGQVAYTATWSTRSVAGVSTPGNAIKIWNVAGNVPVLVDSLIIQGIGTVSDVQISDDGQLLVASLEGGGNAGLAIFNRTDPLRPTLVRRYTSPNTVNGVHTVKLGRINGRLYAFLSSSFGGRLTIVDITDPLQAVDVFSQQIATNIHDVFIRDGVLFTAIWDTGMRIYDVGGAGRGGSPSSPVPLGTVKTAPCRDCGAGTSSVHNIWWFHDPTTNTKRYAFIGEEGPSSLFSNSRGAIHVVDVSDFNAPREVAMYEPLPSTTATGQVAGAHNFVMDEPSGILYAAFYNGGVRALDVQGDLSSCSAAQRTPDGRCDLLLMGREVGVAVNNAPPRSIWGVALVGNHLYASDMPNGIHKIDITALKR